MAARYANVPSADGPAADAVSEAGNGLPPPLVPPAGRCGSTRKEVVGSWVIAAMFVVLGGFAVLDWLTEGVDELGSREPSFFCIPTPVATVVAVESPAAGFVMQAPNFTMLRVQAGPDWDVQPRHSFPVMLSSMRSVTSDMVLGGQCCGAEAMLMNVTSLTLFRNLIAPHSLAPTSGLTRNRALRRLGTPMMLKAGDGVGHEWMYVMGMWVPQGRNWAPDPNYAVQNLRMALGAGPTPSLIVASEWSADSRWIATVHEDGSARLWSFDPTATAPSVPVWLTAPSAVSAVAFADNSAWSSNASTPFLFVAEQGGRIRRWNLDLGGWDGVECTVPLTDAAVSLAGLVVHPTAPALVLTTTVGALIPISFDLALLASPWRPRSGCPVFANATEANPFSWTVRPSAVFDVAGESVALATGAGAAIVSWSELLAPSD